MSDFSEYKCWLTHLQSAGVQNDIDSVKESFREEILNSVAYQKDATRNGASQSLAAVRKDTNKINVTAIDGDELYIGDLIYVFKEYWICVKAYTDEYGMRYGELWLCNQILNYQDSQGKIIHKNIILDDGSYSKKTDNDIPVTSNTYTCYMPIDEDSKHIFIDKRFALDTIYNSFGEKILDVGRVAWIDTRSNNFGDGSHLMTFGLSDDVYNAETDNIEKLICDYIQEKPQTQDNENSVVTAINIVGRENMRVGTRRTYHASIIKENGVSEKLTQNIFWEIKEGQKGINAIPQENGDCLVEVPFDENLIGSTFILSCNDTSGKYNVGNKKLAVIAFG